MTTALDEKTYEELALPELKALVSALDALDLEGFEAELASDILTLEFEDHSRYVVNSHRAARQIWMAAERSAWHFDWDPDQRRWVAAKTREELWQTLADVVSRKLGRQVVWPTRP